MIEITADGFRRDGAPWRILSGALHYFRFHPDDWDDRLAMVAAMGLNTVETYVAWNAHERRPGVFDFSGGLDLGRFIDLAGERGLDVIVRPGPYICAEWDGGGLPSSLLACEGLRLRCGNQQYLEAVSGYFAQLLPIIAERQASCGGPVTMVQVENEYGSYGTDTSYLRWIADAYRSAGIEVPLFTSDGATDWMLTGGMVPGILETANFGSESEREFATLRRFQPAGPLMCMEFWNGWFDQWGEAHHTRSAADAASALRGILAAGASVNLYMACGGTNFGTTAGANLVGPSALSGYQATITSYDYDAPIDEAGRPTEKFWAFREAIGEETGASAPPVPETPSLCATVRARSLGAVRLLDIIDQLAGPAERAATPLRFEQLGLNHGLVLYRTEVAGPRTERPLILEELADRAEVFVDGESKGHSWRGDPVEFPFAVPGDRSRLEILVESMGRVNYGPRLGDRKGLASVRHGQQLLHQWTMRAIPLDGDDKALRCAAADRLTPADNVSAGGGPVIILAELDLEQPGPAYLRTPGLTKGYVWINGFGLGRYWDRGPQTALYVPAAVLRSGINEVTILDVDGCDDGTVETGAQSAYDS